MELGAATWTEIGSPLVVVPVGSCEQHGPHLPVSTDTLIATALAAALVRTMPDGLLAPAVTIAASGEHDGFPGTLSIGAAVLEEALVELVRSADWARGVVLVNGHGGNVVAMERAVTRSTADGRAVLGWSPKVAGGDLHAGETETSIMLALHPELVRIGAAVDGPSPPVASLVRDGIRAHSPSGVLGTATAANAERGARLVAGLVADLVAATDAWRRRIGAG